MRTECPKSPRGTSRGGSRRPSTGAVEPLIRVGDDFEDEYPGASALATECYANLWRAADLLMELHNRQTSRRIPALAERPSGPRHRRRRRPAPRTERDRRAAPGHNGSMTSLLDNLEKRGLIRRQPHPEDRRKLLIDITPAAQAIVDELLPSMHARERDVMAAALSPSEQRSLLRLLAKLQQAALQARSAPVQQGAARRKPSRPSD